MPDEVPNVPVVTPVVHAVEDTPNVVIHTTKDTAELPSEAMHGAFTALNTTLDKLNTTLGKLLIKSEEVVAAPVDATTDTVEDVIPDVEAPQSRSIRRNGRRLKRA